MIPPPMPIHFSVNLGFQNFVTPLWKYRDAPSYWKSMPSGPCSSKIGVMNLSTRDTISTSVSVAFQMERFVNFRGRHFKFAHIDYLNAFIFHSSAFRLMSNFEVE
jgi:hypothetical protein